MRDWLARAPLLIVVTVLLLAGGREYVVGGEDSAAAALVGSGLVVLGAWLALEVVAVHQRMHTERDEEEEVPDDG